MAADSGLLHPTPATRNIKSASILPQRKFESSNADDQVGFIVQIQTINWKRKGFLAWAESGVAEISPNRADACVYSTWPAARIASQMAFGHAVKQYSVTILRVAC